MLSRPAWARHTSGKSTSTPASISEVATRRTGKPSFSRSRTSASTWRRCAGHISVVRWRRPSCPSNASNSLRAWARLLTMHSIRGASAKRAAITSSSTGSGSTSTLTRFSAV